MCHRRLVTHIARLEDAQHLARTVFRHFGVVEAVTVVNCTGGVVDTYALDPVAAGDATRLAAIGCAIAGIEPACLVLVLVSSRPSGGAHVLSETDVDLWQDVHDQCADEGIHLADWFIIDDQVVRSMALSCSPGAAWSLRRPTGEE